MPADEPAARFPDADWPRRWLGSILGYEPENAELFRAALTHRSATGPNNERLEFLGDSVLNLVIARRLYDDFPAADEGDLSRLRARLVSGPPLAEIAAGLGLGEALVLGSGELKSGGFRRESILSDALEALIGAVYLDRGLAGAEALVLRLFAGRIEALPAPSELKDAKTRLQEFLQGRGLALPEYQLTGVSGEPHEQTFAVQARVQLSPRLGSEVLSARGEGTSRRRAEQVAAGQLLEQLRARAP